MLIRVLHVFLFYGDWIALNCKKAPPPLSLQRIIWTSSQQSGFGVYG